MKQHVEGFGRIGVLMGGFSSEREVSLKSGTAVYHALREEGCDVIGLDIREENLFHIKDFIKNAGIELAFIALHGQLGEDGIIQNILDNMGISYVGSGKTASECAFDKEIANNLFQFHGLPRPKFFAINKNIPKGIQEKIDTWEWFPCVVKPAMEGSSIGVSIVADRKGIEKAFEKAFQYGEKIIVEEFIKGREVTVGVLGKRALPVVEILPREGFFDFFAKYNKEGTDYVVPADFPEDVTRNIQETALKAFQALGCRHFARVDFILSKDMTPYVLEVNTIPGFTATSLLPKAAAQEGVSFNQLCLKLVGLAYGT